MKIHPIILCGGDGKRLWPLSRKKFPKQFLPLLDNQSLLDLSLNRLKKMPFLEKPIVITNKDHVFLVKESLQRIKLQGKILLEPIGRNTTSAIYLAAKLLSKNDFMLIMPSDHYFENDEDFSNLIFNTLQLTDVNNWITFGVKPTNPSTSYGYIKLKNKVKSNQISDIDYFVEKPNSELANKLYKDDLHFWNLGIFMGNRNMIINSIKKNAPEVANLCDIAFINKYDNSNGTEINFLLKDFTSIPSISIDYSVMEKSKNIKFAALLSSWSDVGSWDTLSKIVNTKKFGNQISLSSNNNSIFSNKRIIATIGVDDLIVVDSNDATLIVKKGLSENVKNMFDSLEKTNSSITLDHNFENRPWGKFEILLEESYCKVKKLNIFPLKRISLQYHNKRSENWVVVKGEATIHLNDKIIKLNAGQAINIPQGAHHFIENKTNNELIVIETQIGNYFGEDDIVRLDDPYNR